MKSKLQYESPGLIWNSVMDPDQGLMVLEERDQANMEMTFSCIDLLNDKVLFEGLLFEDSWNLGINALMGNLMIMHKYKDADNPIVEKVFAYDINKEAILWEAENFGIERVSEDSLIGYFEREGEHFPHVLDIMTGEAEYLDDQAYKEALIGAAKKGAEKMDESLAQYPLHYTEENDHFETFRKFIEQKMGLKPEKAVDYLETDTWLILSFYTIKGNGLDNILLVLDKDGNVLLNTLINANSKGIAFDPFFVYQNKLIFVRDRGELCIFE
ncbi:DUF4905 domain-containing protein [Aureibacter tunicatorum]|uniref:DUF4905 domain-containing protein n=1 Tax=Aureibacter tunicatorum TaxID=866807 RepID=A0AAE3XKV0_9BACT|nr:DUF4905 domain-containing protein [Aureibacter tunicatorum]MDR6238282.1 hypothetical protein [Aureibacter tunicatorum]BDD03315.1 hypothetical protein AUTU_07980 [Aureibacter tunicatorum]